MEKSNIRHYNFRLNYDNPRHVDIIDILDDLNLRVHKSKNNFICNAIEYYVAALDRGDLTNKAREKREAEKAQLVTKKDLERFREEIFTELYREVFRVLGSANITVGKPANQGITAGCGSPETDVNTGQNHGSDVSQTLGQYDNVLAQVMSWSED